MSKEEFINELNKHDWYYIMSDDPVIYDNGRFNNNRLLNLSKDNVELKELYNKKLQETNESIKSSLSRTI